MRKSVTTKGAWNVVNLLILLLLVPLTSCGESDSDDISNSGEPSFAPLFLNDGETATYRFIFRGVEESTMTLSVIEESETGFAVQETIGEVQNSFFVRKEPDVSGRKIEGIPSNEAIFILTGGVWNPEFPGVNDGLPPSSPPSETIRCPDTEVSVSAGVFKVTCSETDFVSSQGTPIYKMISYRHANSPTYPFGMIIRQEIIYLDGSSSSIVEMTSWNGL